LSDLRLQNTMSALISKTALFLVLLLVASQLLLQPFVYHPFWGAPLFISKYDQFFDSNTNYDAVFIGSSRTFRNTNPFIFDSISGLKSFNFGIEEVGCPFNYDLTDRVLGSKKATEINYLFLELFSPENNLPEELMSDVNQTNKALFWYQPADFIFSFRALAESRSLAVREKYDEVKVHFFTLIQTLFKIGHVQRIVDSEQKQLHDLYLGARMDGFYSYDEEIKTKYGDYLNERYEKIREDQPYFDTRRTCSSDEYLSQFENYSELKFHRAYIEELNRKCEKKGIQLVLVLQPRMTEKQCEYFHRFDVSEIKNIPILDYSSSNRHPAYYQIDNVFDQGHLNTKGAHIFTSTLAQDFNQIANQQNK